MAVPEVLFFKVLRTHTHGSSRWCGHDFHTHGSKLQTIMFGKERGSMRHKGAVRQMSHRRVLGAEYGAEYGRLRKCPVTLNPGLRLLVLGA